MEIIVRSHTREKETKRGKKKWWLRFIIILSNEKLNINELPFEASNLIAELTQTNQFEIQRKIRVDELLCFKTAVIRDKIVALDMNHHVERLSTFSRGRLFGYYVSRM